MKNMKMITLAMLILPAVSSAEMQEPGSAEKEIPERCITVSSGVSETSKQLKSLSSDMGWDLGSFKAMKVAGVLKGKKMASKGQVDVCLKDTGKQLSYQIRVGEAVEEAWDTLTDDPK